MEQKLFRRDFNELIGKQISCYCWVSTIKLITCLKNQKNCVLWMSFFKDDIKYGMHWFIFIGTCEKPKKKYNSGRTVAIPDLFWVINWGYHPVVTETHTITLHP